MDVAQMHTPPNAAAANGAWGAEDQELMDFLFLANPEWVDKPQKASAERPVATIEAPAKTTTKARLTATEKKARHREVVKRSYHRNKQTTQVLKEQVKQLEDQFRALTAAGHPVGANGVDPSTRGRIDELKKQCGELDSTSEQLRKEAVKLQSVILRHQEFARVVQETIDQEMEESTSEEEEDTSTWSMGSASPSPSTSSEDVSPVKMTVKRALYASTRPTHVVDIAQPAPVARDARKEIGFVPLTPLDAKTIISRTTESIVQFTLSGSLVSTGGHVLGWEDRRLIDGSELRFSLRKEFTGQNAFNLMAKTWQCFSDPECATQKFRGLMELRILQHVNDDTLIALRDTASPETNKVYRTVYMLFRVRTSRGFLIGVRSIDDAKFLTDRHKHQFNRKCMEIQWVDMNGWFVFGSKGYMDHAAGAFVETATEVEYGGMMNYGDVRHTMQLAMDSLSLVLKWESMMVGPLFTLPPSTTAS